MYNLLSRAGETFWSLELDDEDCVEMPMLRLLYPSQFTNCFQVTACRSTVGDQEALDILLFYRWTKSTTGKHKESPRALFMIEEVQR